MSGLSPSAPSLPADFWPAIQARVAPGPWPPQEPTRAESFVTGCHRHGLLPLLSIQQDLPAEVAGALSRQAALVGLHRARAMIFERGVDEVRRLLRGERFAFLKGVDYGRRLYPELALRPMQDIDVLVPPDRYDAVCAMFEASGLIPVFPGSAATRGPGYYERAFLLGQLQVEVHRAFIQTSRYPVDYEGIWSRMLARDAGEWALDPVDALAYQALNLAVDQFRARLGRFLDLWLLCSDAGQVERATRRARAWGSRHAFYATFHVAAELFPCFAQAGFAAIAARGLPPLRRRLLGSSLVSQWDEFDAPRAPRWLELLRKAALLDGWSRVAAFALEWATDSFGGLRRS